MSWKRELFDNAILVGAAVIALAVGTTAVASSHPYENGIKQIGELPSWPMSSPARVFTVQAGNHFCIIVDKPGQEAHIACP